jgi:hypothetical protein
MAAAATCPLFLGLETRVNELKEKFIRDQIEAEAADPSFFADLDRLAAFRLLVHAEIEEFLENKATEGLNTLESSFKQGSQAIRANLGLLVVGAMLGKVAKFDAPQWDMYLTEVVAAARLTVQENNGIKERSFLQLAVFSGKMPDETDVALSSALTAYGKSRGDVAHKSVKRVRNIRAPSAESKDADDLIAGLRGFFC